MPVGPNPSLEGTLHAAVWLVDREGPALRCVVAEARCHRLVFLGHLLSAGMVALVTVVVCYAMARAPPRGCDVLRNGAITVHLAHTHRRVR